MAVIATPMFLTGTEATAPRYRPPVGAVVVGSRVRENDGGRSLWRVDQINPDRTYNLSSLTSFERITWKNAPAGLFYLTGAAG